MRDTDWLTWAVSEERVTTSGIMCCFPEAPESQVQMKYFGILVWSPLKGILLQKVLRKDWEICWPSEGGCSGEALQ